MEKKNEQQVVKFEAYLKNLFERDKPTTEELTQWAWNFKVGSALQIDFVDAETDSVKVRYLGKEFRVTMIDNELLDKIFKTIEDVIYTTLLLNCDNMKEEERQELLFKFTRLKTCLSEQYSRGKENYNRVIELARKGPVINPPDFKFPTVDNTPSTDRPTYVFNNIYPEDAEELIKLTKKLINNGANIKVNFANK